MDVLVDMVVKRRGLERDGIDLETALCRGRERTQNRGDAGR